MANYSIVINSKFKPFSYQELLAPAMQMTQEHHAIEEAYGDLATKAGIWETLANEQTDKKAYQMYKRYADDLRAQANSLASRGLTPTSRSSLYGMKSRYAQEITPIEIAYKKREEQAKEQRTAEMQNPTLLLSRRAATTSLDDYIDNPSLDYKSYSGALITQQVAAQAQAVAKELREARISGTEDKYINIFTQKNGIDPREIEFAINNPNDPRANKVLLQMVDSVIDSTGIASWNNADILERARNFGFQGLWSGVGETKLTPIENKAALKQLEHAQAVDLLNRKAAAEAAADARKNKYALQQINARAAAARQAAASQASAQTPAQVNNMHINNVPLRDQNELNQHATKIQKFIEDQLISVGTDGRLHVTDKGWKRFHSPKLYINTNNTYAGATLTSAGKRSVIDDEFYNFMNTIGAGKVEKGFKTGVKQGIDAQIKKGNVNIGMQLVHSPKLRTAYKKSVVDRVDRLLNNYHGSMQQGVYDTYRTSELVTQVTPAYGKLLLANASVNKGKDGLEVVEFGKNKAGGRTFNKIDALKGGDIGKDAYITDVRTFIDDNGKAINTAIVYQPEKDPVRIKLPAGLNPAAEANIASYGSFYKDYTNIVHKGKVPVFTTNSNGKQVVAKDANGRIKYTDRNLTDADMYKIIPMLDNSGSGIVWNQHQLVVPQYTENYKVSATSGSNSMGLEDYLQGLFEDSESSQYYPTTFE